MPQLIAMIIIVVGAMIYMFQTFGGTGDKIEGVAQKTSIVTEINNLKNGLQLALRGGDINKDDLKTLKQLAELGYFADQMNNDIKDNDGAETFDAKSDNRGKKDTYSAISFGGENKPALFLTYIKPTVVGAKPAIRVQFLENGTLWANRGFLESQLANDLQAIAAIDRTTTDGSHLGVLVDNEVPKANRPKSLNVTKNTTNKEEGTASGTDLEDGVFTIYFRDLPGIAAK